MSLNVPLDLNPDSKSSLESLPISELIDLYKEKVGVPPRTKDNKMLISALDDPLAELARLREIDREEDKEELASPYKK